MKISDLQEYKVVGSGDAFLPKVTEKPKQVGGKLSRVAQAVTKFVGAGGISEQFGADIARLRSKNDAKDLVFYPSQRKVVGSAIQTGALLVPGAASGAGLAAKVAAGAGTGYAFDVGSKLQGDGSTSDSFKPGIATAVGAALPIAGAVMRPAVAMVGRLMKGLGSGLSGVSTKTIESIVDNPKVAQETADKLAKSGNASVLEENAKQIVNGVSKIRSEASKAFKTGLEELQTTDINPATFREGLQPVLEKYGSEIKDGVRTIANVEFDDPKNLSKASNLIDRLSNVELNGKSLRKLADDIESSTYKIATSDERLSFNAFLKDLSNSLKGVVSASTPKLEEINKAFSQDAQLAEAVQNIFGKVNFRNLPEVVKASQKLENLFTQKGLAPDVIDSFLTRIGVAPADFKASEAARQITDKVSGSNTKGLTFSELFQNVTSAVITPKIVRDISIFTGLAEQQLVPFFQAMKPAARKLLLESLVQATRFQEGRQ